MPVRSERVDLGADDPRPPSFFGRFDVPRPIWETLITENLARARVFTPVIAAVMLIFLSVDRITVQANGSAAALAAGDRLV